MNNDKMDLNNISKQLDENFTKKSYKFFKPKNEDEKLVGGYSKILSNLTSFFRHNKPKNNECLFNKPLDRMIRNSVTKSSQIKEVSLSNNRCKKCNCSIKNNSSSQCSYCDVTQEILLVDNDEKKRKNNNEMMKGIQKLSPIKFYDKECLDEENVPCSKKKNDTVNKIQVSEKYPLDYLFIGTYRFISRSFIRLDEDNLVINFLEYNFNLNYQYIKKLFFWEDKVNSNHIYVKIKVDFQTHKFINESLGKILDKTIRGSFEYESINSHKSMIIAKLHLLSSDVAKNLRNKLGYFMKNNFALDKNLPKIFEEQRAYTHKDVTKKKHKSYSNITSSSSVPSCSFKEELPSSLKMIDSDSDMEVKEIKREKSIDTKINFDEIKSKKVDYWFNGNETITIYKNDVYCLKEKTFLNDKIIEFYLLYIKYKLIPVEIQKKTYIFSTFFFSKMLSSISQIKDQSNFNQEIYNSVKNWTKNVDIFDYDFLIVPIFRDHHWSLALICYPFKTLNDDFEDILDEQEFERSCIIFMDSMGRDKNCSKFSKVLRIFLEQECYNKKKSLNTFNESTLITLIPKVPCQLNGYDCGIFVLHYVELFLKDPSIIFSNKRLSSISLQNWFNSSSLNNKRKEIFKILCEIFSENTSKTDSNVESDEDSKMKSDDEIEILTDNDKNLLTSDDEDMIE